MQVRRWAFAIFAMLPVALEVRGKRGIRTAGEGCRPVVWDLRGAQASPSARRPGGGGRRSHALGAATVPQIGMRGRARPGRGGSG